MFSVSENPNNALWIEIHIMDRDLRMPFSDFQIQKHINYLQEVSDQENKGLDRIKIHLVQIVMCQSTHGSQVVGTDTNKNTIETENSSR